MRTQDEIRQQIRDLEVEKEVIELKLKRKEEELKEAKGRSTGLSDYGEF